jgi:serine/threonine protein kinase
MNPIFAVLGMSGGELFLLFAMAVVFLVLVLSGTITIVWLFKRRNRELPPKPPSAFASLFATAFAAKFPPPTPPKPPSPGAIPPKECPQCHQIRPADAPEGLCPQCLAKAAFRTEPTTPRSHTGPEPAQLAAQFPQLEIVELLGMGGMGMVYKARQPRLDRFVALKILPIDSTRGASFAERFEREAKALAKLNHPGIVTLYEFGQTAEYYYFIMEYVDGMNLRQLLQAQPIEPRHALEMVTQICGALQFAHDEKIVHRDIKPENILINKKGQVKIADFGLAKLLGAAPDTELTMSQAAMGTLNYMAPEQRQNAQGVDHRADIYSLGVVFYEMLTGEVPMGRFEPPSKRVQVDVRLDEVVLRALEREPARRYQHAGEVKTDVESLTENRPGKQARNQPQPAAEEWPAVAVEVGKNLALIAMIGFTMGMLHSALPLLLLLICTLTFDQSAGPQEKRWGKAVWVVGVIGLSGYGVWISKTAWPLVGLFLMFDWGEGKEEEEESDEKKGGSEGTDMPPTDGASAALPFVIRNRVWGPFGSVIGLMRLETDALALEFEVKSILPSVRKPLREVRIPYGEIVLADFDRISRLVLRTARTVSLAEVPTSSHGEVKLYRTGLDDMSKRAAKKFVVALNRRIAGRIPPSP